MSDFVRGVVLVGSGDTSAMVITIVLVDGSYCLVTVEYLCTVVKDSWIVGSGSVGIVGVRIPRSQVNTKVSLPEQHDCSEVRQQYC